MKSQATIFNFESYSFDVKKRIAYFNYEILFSDSNKEALTFTEQIILPRGLREFTQKELDRFLEPIFLILGISYYKLYLPPKIKMSVKLSRQQADFWNTVYRKGLGEFLYKNKLDPKNVAKFPSVNNFHIAELIKTKTQNNKAENSENNNDHNNENIVSIKTKSRVLLGIGGGKDSIVAAELLKENNIPTTSFLLETQRSDDVIDLVLKNINNPVIKIKRILDEKLFEEHEGSYNGHVPISAIFAFLGLLSAALYEHKYITVANEYSSNFGNVSYKGAEINHQWSKSLEFEMLFQEYTKNFITKDILYFSILREFYEIRITELFTKYKKYFSVFTSCNRNFYINKQQTHSLWCGECAKCHFAFLMLSAFISKKELEDIFNKNLFADVNNIPMFKDLLGMGGMKPFDCVGTVEESQASLYLAREKFASDIVVKTLFPKLKNPEKAVERVFKTNIAPTLPTEFRFLGIKNICILGYGKEGKITEKYLKKKYPHIKVDILDKSDDMEYLEKQKNYDFAIKTPGIHKSKITIPYTTATNIFFSEVKNLTIGVTGTKGKSTTVSLIHDILETAGKKVRLVGNIGTPMVSVLLNKIDPEEIFVVELSSFQLDDIEYSPNIAVLLNVFEGHSADHGGYKQYKQAKENIFRFQKEGDVFIQGPLPTSLPIGFKQKDIPLLGKHNIRNINTAIRVAKELKVSDANIKKAIKNFKSLPHRLENVGTFKGISFYNDSIASSPDAAIAALQTLKNVDTLFLGGSKQKFDFRELEKTIHSSKIRNVVLFEENGKLMIKNKKKLNIFNTDNMHDAVEFAYKNTKKGKICLLSPASSSKSLWRDFEDRGDEFRRSVRKVNGK